MDGTSDETQGRDPFTTATGHGSGGPLSWNPDPGEKDRNGNIGVEEVHNSTPTSRSGKSGPRCPNRLLRPPQHPEPPPQVQ